MPQLAEDHRVTPLELFFDLVFVFAVTQVTATLEHDLSWRGLGRGLLIVAALWWAWAAYAWLTNASEHRDPSVRVLMFAAMATMLVAAIVLPDAFGEHAVAFGIAYFIFRALHLLLFWIAGRDVQGIRMALLRLSPNFLAAPALIAVAGFLGPTPRVVLWIAAISLDYSSPVLRGMAGWHVAPAHFVERHGLIVIIALGESIVAVGVGAGGLPVGSALISGIVLAMLVVAGLWWAYFDEQPDRVERRLLDSDELPRAVLARDLFSYLHMPMVAGIILFALGVTETLGHTGEELDGIPALALGGGVALYLASLVAFRLRAEGALDASRLLAAGASLACVAFAMTASALAALAALAAVVAVLTAWEARPLRQSGGSPELAAR